MMVEEAKELLIKEGYKKMKINTLKVALDINNNPYVIDACMLDGELKSQSTFEYLVENFNNFGNWVDVGVPSEAGIYKLRIVFTYPDDVENIFTKVKEYK